MAPIPPFAHAADAIGALAEGHRIADLLHRQTAILVLPGHADGLRPLFRDVGFRREALAAHDPALAGTLADPFLDRHFATRLGARLLEAVLDGQAAFGWRPDGPPLHVSLTLPLLRSDAFARFAALCRERRLRAGIGIAAMEACADPDAFAAARARLRDDGLALALEGVTPRTLALAAIEALAPDLVKLDWSPGIPDADAGARAALADAVARIGPARLVLRGADTEAALRWGMSAGLRRFAGRHVGAMLAASRLMACPHAAGCTLRQCAARAESASPAGRRLCAAPRHLDDDAPPSWRLASCA